jgi:hypothetical protein
MHIALCLHTKDYASLHTSASLHTRLCQSPHQRIFNEMHKGIEICLCLCLSVHQVQLRGVRHVLSTEYCTLSCHACIPFGTWTVCPASSFFPVSQALTTCIYYPLTHPNMPTQNLHIYTQAQRCYRRTPECSHPRQPPADQLIDNPCCSDCCCAAERANLAG